MKSRFFTLLFTLAIFFGVSGYTPVLVTLAYAEDRMTLEESYAVSNKERIPFEKSESMINTDEAEYLDHLFLVTDMVFRERMEMLRHFNFRKSELYIDTYIKNIDELVNSFNKNQAPNHELRRIEAIIVSAIADHKNFFIRWHNARGTQLYGTLRRDYSTDSYVQRSHKKLMEAYVSLMTLYPDEIKNNQNAFYQHLCALDFI